MSKLFSDLQTGTRVYLDESQQTDWLDTEVKAAINFAYHQVIMEVMMVYEDFYNTVTPTYISTVANQQEYALNTGLIKIRRVEINYNPSDPNSTALRATAIKTEELPLRLASNNNSGSGLFNAGYYINGPLASQVIGFVPPPQHAGTNNVAVWGIQLPSDLVISTDPVSIPWADNFSWLINIKAAIDLLRKGQQEESVVVQYMKDYDEGIMKMKNFLKERQADGVDMVIDAQMQDIVFDSYL